MVNFLSNKECSHLHIPEALEIFKLGINKIFVDTEWAEVIDPILLLDSKEKALYAGSVFLKGKVNRIGRSETAFTPLYIHELRLVEQEGVYAVELLDTYVNPVFVECANAIDETLKLKYDELVEKLPNVPFCFENLVRLEEGLKVCLPNWDLADLNFYHKVDQSENVSYVQSIRHKRTIEKKVFAGFMFGLFKRSKGSLGVLSELNTLADSSDHSDLLKRYFSSNNKKKNTVTKLKPRQIFVPAHLSEAQKSVFYAQDRNQITMVVGPPGTGKTHTMSALTADLLTRGESVLIISRSKQAGKVISNMIENVFGMNNILIKTERATYKNRLARRFERMTYFSHKTVFEALEPMENNINYLWKRLLLLEKEINLVEEKEIKWGRFYFKNSLGIFSGIKNKWIEYRKEKTRPIWKIHAEIDRVQKKILKQQRTFVKAKFERVLDKALLLRREEFKLLRQAMIAETGNLVDEKFREIDFDLILKALPAWVCNTNDVSKYLPLQKELFDVVIVDEASQCDMASMIPILQRARKVLVVGDPNQLRHYSFLSRRRQNELKQKYGIDTVIPDYRNESLIDWTNEIIKSQAQVVFLDEHYRSQPGIIHFSNVKFYENRMKIMRSSPSGERQPSVEVVTVSGQRDAKGYNKVEAEKLLEKLQTLVDNEYDLRKSQSTSIGILSPFQDQVRYIKKMIRKNMDSGSLTKHRLLVGTPYHFQGEERDVMLLSFVLDDKSHIAAFNYLNKPNVFNVSITRARNKQIIFTSSEFRKLSEEHLLSKYLNSISELRFSSDHAETVFDVFVSEVVTLLYELGIDETYKNTFLSGVRVDLAVVKGDETYAIDLIGYPGEFEKQFSAANLRLLSRMNRRIFFIPYSSWVLDREKISMDLQKFLN